jgi:hypothetical protein
MQGKLLLLSAPSFVMYKLFTRVSGLFRSMLGDLKEVKRLVEMLEPSLPRRKGLTFECQVAKWADLKKQGTLAQLSRLRQTENMGTSTQPDITRILPSALWTLEFKRYFQFVAMFSAFLCSPCTWGPMTCDVSNFLTYKSFINNHADFVADRASEVADVNDR